MQSSSAGSLLIVERNETMGQSHSFGRKCGMELTCHAYWSLNSTEKLLFFVHGFGGDAIGAWNLFPGLLLSDDRWDGWDLFFYGYDSRRMRAGVSANVLKAQVEHLMSRPDYANPWLPGYLPRSKDFRYKEIWFITHSLGAPVTRQMLLRCADLGLVWVGASRLICFAPASTGARINRLERQLGAWGGFPLGAVLAYINFKWTVIEDMEPGSKFLQGLLNDTRRAVQRSPSPDPFYSRLAVFGTHDDIIDSQPPFEFDAVVAEELNVDHYNICKPSDLNSAPYRHLVRTVNPP